MPELSLSMQPSFSPCAHALQDNLYFHITHYFFQRTHGSLNAQDGWFSDLSIQIQIITIQ